MCLFDEVNMCAHCKSVSNSISVPFSTAVMYENGFYMHMQMHALITQVLKV